jgi:hypothetical protein
MRATAYGGPGEISVAGNAILASLLALSDVTAMLRMGAES